MNNINDDMLLEAIKDVFRAIRYYVSGEFLSSPDEFYKNTCEYCKYCYPINGKLKCLNKENEIYFKHRALTEANYLPLGCDDFDRTTVPNKHRSNYGQ